MYVPLYNFILKYFSCYYNIVHCNIMQTNYISMHYVYCELTACTCTSNGNNMKYEILGTRHAAVFGEIKSPKLEPNWRHLVWLVYVKAYINYIIARCYHHAVLCGYLATQNSSTMLFTYIHNKCTLHGTIRMHRCK